MSKQDIEKRLGFAAQGVKETTRTSAKAEMGFLSRVGYAATALTADPADPKSPEYRKQVSEAKAAAKDAITNYKFMRDKVKERLAALDAYVTNAIKVINSATSAKDIEHYVEQLRIAVKSQSMILGASKSPFSRAGAKAKFGLSPSEMKENQRRIETNIRYEAGVIRDVSSNMRFIKDEIQRLTAEIKNTRDIKRKAQLSLKLDAENKKMKDQVAYLRRARQMIQENQADAKSLGITLDAKWAGNFARPGVKAKMSATFIVAEAIFNAENAVRRGDNENARRWIKAAQDAMDETVVSTGMRSKLEQLVKRYKMSRPGVKAKMAANNVDLWNYLSKSDVQIARQTPNDLAMLKKYAQRALTMPDFTPPAYAKNGPSLHAMAKDTLLDIRAWEDSTSRERARYARPTTKAKA